jgi:hypothetical protein
MNPTHTERQGQFLAYIHHYSILNGCAPAEADMQRFFQITPPDRILRLIVKFRMASDEKNFNLSTTRQLFEAKKLVRGKKWEKTIPRKNQ